MDDTTAPAAGIFDRVADAYDAVGVAWFGPIADLLVRQLGPRPGERALDVGCGRGAALAPLANAVGRAGTAVGVDLAPGMVRRTAADLAHLPQTRVVLGDAAALALDDAPFDVVASSLVLFFLTDPLAALRGWVDLLVPGGRLGISTFGAQDDTWTAVDAVFRPYLPKTLLDARTSGAAGPFASDAGVERLFADAGLIDVRTIHHEEVARFRDVAQWEQWTWSHGQRVMWEHVPEEEREGVRSVGDPRPS